MIVKALKEWDDRVKKQDEKRAKDQLARSHFGYPNWEAYERDASQAEHMERNIFMVPPGQRGWWG